MSNLENLQTPAEGVENKKEKNESSKIVDMAALEGKKAEIAAKESISQQQDDKEAATLLSDFIGPMEERKEGQLESNPGGGSEATDAGNATSGPESNPGDISDNTDAGNGSNNGE